MLNVLYKAVFNPLDVFSPKETKGSLGSSVLTVLAASLLGSVAGPLAYYYMNRQTYAIDLDIAGMFAGLAVSLITPLAVCVLFYIMAKAFKKEVGLRQVVSLWGLSYIPNFLCVVLYYLLMLFPGIYIESGLAAFILSVLFIGFLVWKAIFYFMFLKCVLNVTLREFIIITVVSAAVFTLLMMAGMKAGVQVPML